jgi:hypothetical protein
LVGELSVNLREERSPVREEQTQTWQPDIREETQGLKGERMLIKVTEKRVTTRLTKPEIKRIESVQTMLDLLARHQPKVQEYADARDALEAVTAMWNYKDKEQTDGREPASAPEE